MLLRHKQFLSFAQVGVIGFLADWACIHCLLALGTGFYLGRAGSYLFAATVTWVLNRAWTFRSDDPPLRQWIAFLSANAVGGAVNYATSAFLAFQFKQTIFDYPVIAVAAGALAGLAFNFCLSKKMVFRT